jgi:uncharacterized protein (DUF924 family)
MSAISPSPADVLDFWFGDHARARWFAKDPAFDTAIRTRFATAIAAATAGELDGWAADPASALALTILLDQFPRNIHRGSPCAFEADAHARRIAAAAIDLGFDRATPLDRRMFFYLPFQHGESLADQDRSVELFSQWAAEHIGDARAAADEDLGYALHHREVIQRFGRFPHRNAALGRASTPEELAFLESPGSSY